MQKTVGINGESQIYKIKIKKGNFSKNAKTHKQALCSSTFPLLYHHPNGNWTQIKYVKKKIKKQRIHKHCIKEERGPCGCGSRCQGEERLGVSKVSHWIIITRANN